MPARTLSTMFIWHTELLIISLLFCTAFAATLFTLDMYSSCVMDLTTSLSVCTSALVTLVCHVIIACSRKQEIVSKDAKEHASVSLALVQVVFCITLVHTLFQKEDFSVICFGATSAFNGLATCLSFVCAFTATEVGNPVPLFLKSDGLVVSACTLFAFMVVTDSTKTNNVFSENFPLMLFAWAKDLTRSFVGSDSEDTLIFYLTLLPVSTMCLVRSILMDIFAINSSSKWMTILPHSLWSAVIFGTLYTFSVFYATGLIDTQSITIIYVLLLASLGLEAFSIIQGIGYSLFTICRKKKPIDSTDVTRQNNNEHDSIIHAAAMSIPYTIPESRNEQESNDTLNFSNVFHFNDKKKLY